MDGIYRVSGNLAVVQKLRFLVDRGEKASGTRTTCFIWGLEQGLTLGGVLQGGEGVQNLGLLQAAQSLFSAP